LIPVNRPLIDRRDIDAVAQALENTWISGDTPPVQQMEEMLASKVGTEHAIAVSSGTSALDLAVNAIGISDRSKVIAPTFTIISTVSEVMRKGAEILLVDADMKTWGMDTEFAESALTEEIDLIIPVHIYGLPVPLKKLNESARKMGVFVLEDAAEVLGQVAEDSYLGAASSAGIYSFYANKIVTGGEGGAIVTNDTIFATKARYLRNLCFRPEERFVHTDLGWNSRLGGLQAALISSQLSRLHELVAKKKEIGKIYREGLISHPWFDLQPQFASTIENIYWVVGLLLNEESKLNAVELQAILREKGVDTRRFFCPIHLQPVAKELKVKQLSNLKNSERLWEMGLYLPSGLGTTVTEIEMVIDILWKLV
jgi:perosamine synthetase